MTVPNITNTRPGAAGNSRGAHLNGDQFVKLSDVDALVNQRVTEMAHHMRQQEVAAHQFEQAMVKRSSAIRGSVRERIGHIVDFVHLHRLKTSGAPLTQQQHAALPHLQQRAKISMDSLEEDMIDGQDAKDHIIEQLLESAAEDPVTAAELVSAETGMEVSPAVVEDAAEEVADSAVKNEEGSHTKESAKRTMAVQTLCNHLGPLTQEVLVARANTKVSELRRFRAAQYAAANSGHWRR